MNNSANKLINEFGWEEGTALAHCKANGRCEYCGDNMLRTWESYLGMQIDHLLPKSLYADHEFNFANYVSSCSTCNHLKRKLDVLLAGEDAAYMLSDKRGELIERVVHHLKYIPKKHNGEFETIKAIIQSS